MKSKIWCWVGMLAFVPAVWGQLEVGSDGSDGVFNPGATIVVDLSQAAVLCNCDGIDQNGDSNFIDDPCRWDCPSPVAGKGVYDADKWAVVYKYQSVNIASGRTVTFTNHPSNAPVVWLVQDNVTIGGSVNLWGERAGSASASPTVPGPGGFPGGRATLSSASLGSGGRGPGAAPYLQAPSASAAGSYATQGGNCVGTLRGALYGNEYIVPLIGGSGASACNGRGGAGAGAILIAANGTITINGSVAAVGGEGGGSGGAIRLVANTVAGTGSLDAHGGSYSGVGGYGRIRIEGFSITLPGGNPSPSISEPDVPPMIWPPSDAPRIWATQVEYVDYNGATQTIAVPADPRANIAFPNTDVAFQTDQQMILHIEAANVPQNWLVTVRVVPTSGDTLLVSADALIGNLGSSTTTATFTSPAGIATMQIRADAP